MKVYISADMEGVAGVDHWDEATIGKPGYERSALRMSREVAAACRSAYAAGAREVWVQDAHDSARNLILEELPPDVKIIRGWSDDPRCMAQDLDSSFDALVLIGHHAGSGTGDNPLNHTFSLETVSLKLNGIPADETVFLHYTALYYGVPLVFVSGDEATCVHTQGRCPAVKTVVTKKGVGNSSSGILPQRSVELIEKGVLTALGQGKENYLAVLPPKFHVEIEFRHHGRAHRRSFYPGVVRKSERVLSFETSDFYEVLRMLMFVAY